MENPEATASLKSNEVAIGPVAAAAAVGNMPKLSLALGNALDAGSSINELKEVLVQLYAYVGFPRALNALGVFMKALEDRRVRGVKDEEGRLPGPIPAAQTMLRVGTSNQTKLSGAPVAGPLFEFAPAIDEYLKTHLFGDIFSRDNLDWRSRELATVAALSAMSGVEAQLLAHIRISMNVGLTSTELRQFAGGLRDGGEAEAAQRVLAAIERHGEAGNR